MSLTAESLAAELQALAAADVIALPPPAKPAAPKPGEAPPPPPPPPQAIQVCDFAATGIHLQAVLRPETVVEAARIMEKHGFAIDAVTGMDWLAQGLLEVIYDFLHFQSGMRVALRARIPRAEPSIDSIWTVFQGANWHERETHDMFGIVFKGHPDLTPFLLPDDADYHPLLKDFKS